MPTTRFAARALLALAALAPCQAALAQTAYTFTNVVDSTMVSGFTFLDDIAFDGDTVAVGGAARIFKVTAGVPTTIATVGQFSPVGTLQNFGSFRRIGLSEGNVSFVANTNSLTAVLRGSGGSLTKIAAEGDMSPNGTISFLPGDTMASISGTSVAFKADTATNTNSGIFIGSGGPLSTIRPPVNTSHVGPTLSGNRAAFVEFPRGLGGSPAIYTSDGGALTTIAKAGDSSPAGPIGLVSFFGPPEISGDVVAFHASVPGGRAILTGNGGPLTAIVKEGDAAPGGGVFTSLGELRVANNGQQVAFAGGAGEGDSGTTAMFVSNNGVLSKVIQSGDSLFGATAFVGNVAALDRSGSGRVAFGYFHPGGISGIAIATPVPEPATASLAACAGLAFPLRRRVSPRLA
jgi:hypothetical protein